jgi:hypothetical protein
VLLPRHMCRPPHTLHVRCVCTRGKGEWRGAAAHCLVAHLYVTLPLKSLSLATQQRPPLGLEICYQPEPAVTPPTQRTYPASRSVGVRCDWRGSVSLTGDTHIHIGRSWRRVGTGAPPQAPPPARRPRGSVPSSSWEVPSSPRARCAWPRACTLASRTRTATGSRPDCAGAAGQAGRCSAQTHVSTVGRQHTHTARLNPGSCRSSDFPKRASRTLIGFPLAHGLCAKSSSHTPIIDKTSTTHSQCP